VNVAPCRPKDLVSQDDVPSVIAMSWGKGEPNRDPIHLVFLDEEGRFREHLRLDNLSDGDNRQEFMDLLKRRKPDVIAMSGFTVATKHLMSRVREALGLPELEQETATAAPGGAPTPAPAPANQSGGWGAQSGGGTTGGWGTQSDAGGGGGWGDQDSQAGGGGGGGGGGWGETGGSGGGGRADNNNAPGSGGGGWGDSSGDKPSSQSNKNAANTSGRSGDERLPELMYGYDEVARIYQNSPRAAIEFSALPLIARYCVSIARYVQSPLNEYAALGSDLAAITYIEAQHLVSTIPFT
jgi:transcription elongation factor SPT6